MTNYNGPGYLRNFRDSTYRIRNMLRYCAYQIVCPNRTIGMGERSDGPPIEEFREVIDCYGLDAVYPASDTYKLMARLLDEIMEHPESSYSKVG
jgi:hypothetical protein